jgi:hypothetical protein
MTVRGCFRGANLFGDLREDSRRSPRDWVLWDGQVAAWVGGQLPRGPGFALDPRERADTGWALDVTGVGRQRDGVLYFEATAVRLAGREERCR